MESLTTHEPSASRAARAVGVHGVLLACASPIVFARPSLAVAPPLALALVPCAIWAFGDDRVRRNTSFAFGIVPASVLVAAAWLEGLSPGRPELLGGLRVAAGVVAQLVASALAAPAPRLDVDVSVSDRPASPTPTARARRRGMFLGALALGFAGLVAVAPVVASDSTATERAFAAVAASLLGCFAFLVIVPNAVRKQRRPGASSSEAIRFALVAIVLATAALVVERVTRP